MSRMSKKNHSETLRPQASTPDLISQSSTAQPDPPHPQAAAPQQEVNLIEDSNFIEGLNGCRFSINTVRFYSGQKGYSLHTRDV